MFSNQELFKFSNTNAVPGNEDAMRELMHELNDEFADEVFHDGIGSYIAKKGNGGPKVMIAGHMDEVGFIVKRIDDNGFVYFSTVGGWFYNVMLSQEYTITTEDGTELIAVSGSKPPHILTPEDRKKPVEIDKMFLDLGVGSKQEVLDLGVQVGDMITPRIEGKELNNEKYLLGKAWDNRVGCAIVSEVLRTHSADNTLYAVGTVQEEVGLRGAKTSSQMIMPDIAISIDTGIAGDTPGITADEADNKIGQGPLLFVKDGGLISHRGFLKFAKSVAKELDIPFQLEFLGGGSQDGAAISQSGSGCPTIVISLATRYIHSHTSIIHRDDYENAVKFVEAIVARLDEKALELIKK
ncbi:M42 family metallopeptidase [Mollicutes bacterium LVI A0039]|nr:M42 family metallopeptidase [Mollicutes bacterium LVI A0039]